MQSPFKKSKTSEFDGAIAACLAEMQTYGPGTEEYKAAYDTLKGLTAMRDASREPRVNPDMWVACGTNIFIAGFVSLIEAKGYMLPKSFKDFSFRTKNN